MDESTEQTTCIKFKKRFSLLIYWFFFQGSADLLWWSLSYQLRPPICSAVPGSPADQGTSCAASRTKFKVSSLTFGSARVYQYSNPSFKISFGIDCDRSLFCSKISESARGIVSVRAAKQWVMRTCIIAPERDCSQSTFGKCKKVIALVEYCAIWTFRRFGRQSSRLFRSNPSRQQSSTAVHIEVGYLSAAM